MMKSISKGYWQCILMVCLVFAACIPENIELPSRVKSVTTNEPARITVNSATLCANVNLVDSNKINCGIIYDISSKLSSSIGTKKNTTANGDYSVNLSGLKPNTTYYYRAYAVDAEVYKYGDICSFKTDISVTTTKATDITYNSAILGGSVVSGGQTLTCGVIYGTTSTLSSSNGTMKTTESSGSYSITVSELNPNTTYYYCAYVVIDGEYKYGEVCTFNTLEVTVTTGTATDITENSVILSATINNSEKSLACGIIYGTSSSLSSSSGTKKSTTSSGTFSVSLSGLSSNTTYYYRAYVVVDGEYKYGEVSSFKTSKGVTVSTGSATNVTDTGATLSGTINNSEKSLTCGIIYGTISDVGTKEYTTSSGAFSVSITGLKPNTTYNYRAYVVVDGEYRYGEVSSFKTIKEVTVSTGSVTNVTDTGATLSGTINNSDKSLTCGIIYGTFSILSSSRGTMKSTTSSGTFSVSLSGLSSNTTYYYRAYVVVDGEYKYGEVSSFKTIKEVTVSTGSATDVTDNGATLSGTINNSDKSLTCGIIYGTSSSLSSSSGTKKSTTSSGTFSVSLSGLSPNTTYYYRAYAVVDGEYKYGEVLSFTTIKEVTVSTGSATDVTDNGATLSGTINNSDKSLTCGIIYGTSSSLSSSSGTKKSTTSSGTFSVSLSSLSSNTTYYYRAYVVVDGEYKYGDVLSFTTIKEVTVSTGSATNVTDNGATLSGTINNSDKSLTCGIIYGTSSSLSSSSGTKKSTTSSGTFSVSLSGLTSNTTYYYRAYVVVDGEYKYGDVLSFTTKSTPKPEVVDLGLSVKWASFNIGATSPEDYGGYYAWGETEEKSNYSWSTYKWCNGSNDTMTKYCTSSSFGTVDNKTTLDLSDDVAHVKWGGSWRMPTLDEIKELNNDCSWSWTTQNGVNGYKVTGPNGNSIFLPAAGYRGDGDVYGRGSRGDYWSGTLYSSISRNAHFLYFYSSFHDWSNYNSRYYGHTVRPVKD